MKRKFSGVYTAIVTPFNEKEEVDYGKLKELIKFNIDNGVSGIVPCGTTGESPTLSFDEHMKVVAETVKACKGRCQVIAGAGSNSTRHAIELSKKVEALGADGILSVNPYYNKPTQEGLYRHFKAIADSVKIPIVVYNIKGRTGVNVETATLMRLIKDCKNIIAVKEASGDLNQMKDVIKQRPNYFSVLSGDDGITLDLIKAGGDGIVSVASNVIPKEMSEMTKLALEGKYDAAKKLNDKMAPFFEVEFVETNPIPIKAALVIQGKIKEVYRLPMCELRPQSKDKLLAVMKNMKLI